MKQFHRGQCGKVLTAIPVGRHICISFFSFVENLQMVLCGKIGAFCISHCFRALDQHALEKTGLKADEVIHIGDSLQSDVECPALVGIRSIWLNRKKKSVPSGVVSTNRFSEVLKYCKKGYPIMNRIEIIADAVSYITAAVDQKYGISVLLSQVLIGDQTFLIN